MKDVLFTTFTELFFQMTQSADLLDFNTTKERAIKLISLFQKPEECFKIQPDMGEEFFDAIVFELSACVYENLADASGMMEGFNSKGLHESITDGIQVCRNIGKPGCVQCFREYASDVYLAADDPDLARHQCQTVLNHTGQWQERGDRRWLAKMKLGWIELLQGNLPLAKSFTEESLELCDEEEVSIPLHSKVEVQIQLDSILMLQGLEPQFSQQDFASQIPSAEESPIFDYLISGSRALEAGVNKDFDKAGEVLEQWDRKLSKCNALHYWFENRLRLIALKRIAGESQQAENLAKSLEEKASQADDWLTLRRLNDVLGSEGDPSLLAIPTTNLGSIAPTATRNLVPEERKEDEEVKSPFGEEEPVLLDKLNEMMASLREGHTKIRRNRRSNLSSRSCFLSLLNRLAQTQIPAR